MLNQIEIFNMIYVICVLLYISLVLWVALLLDENVEKVRLRGTCMNRELTNLY
jgi:hypothetical protein